MTITASEHTFSRRTFVKGTGALIVAIGAPKLLNPKAALAAVNGDFPIGPAAVDPNLIDSWIAIGTDNTVTMKVGKVELGQGTVTAAMQLVADELDVPLAGVKFVQSDTWVTPDQGTTAGSQSTGRIRNRLICSVRDSWLLALATAASTTARTPGSSQRSAGAALGRSCWAA